MHNNMIITIIEEEILDQDLKKIILDEETVFKRINSNGGR